MPRTFAILALIIVLGIGASLSAQELSQEDAEEFAQLMGASAAAYEANNFEESIAKLEAARAIYDHPDITYNIARAWSRLERCSRAREMYQAYLAREDVSESDITKAGERLAELDTSCVSRGSLLVRCTALDVELRVGDAPAFSCPFDGVMETGEHRIAASAPGFVATSTSAIVREGETTEVTIELEPLPPPPPEKRTPWAAIGWSAAGAGGAMILGGLILDATSVGRAERLRDASGNADEVESLRKAAKTGRTATILLYSLGLASAATGTGILLFVVPVEREQSRTPVELGARWTVRF